MQVRRLLVAALAAAVLAAAAVGYFRYFQQMTASPDAPAIGGPFRLTAHDGRILGP